MKFSRLIRINDPSNPSDAVLKNAYVETDLDTVRIIRRLAGKGGLRVGIANQFQARRFGTLIGAPAPYPPPPACAAASRLTRRAKKRLAKASQFFKM